MCVRKLPYYRSRAGFGSPLTACVNKLLTRVEVSFRGSQRSSHKTNQKFTKKNIQSVCGSGNDFRFQYLVVAVCQGTPKFFLLQELFSSSLGRFSMQMYDTFFNPTIAVMPLVQLPVQVAPHLSNLLYNFALLAYLLLHFFFLKALKKRLPTLFLLKVSFGSSVSEKARLGHLPETFL